MVDTAVEEAAMKAKTKAEEAAIKTGEKMEHMGEEMRHQGTLDAAMSLPERAPSPLYLGLTLGSIVASLVLYGLRKKEDAIFIGHWAPTFLALGLFAKLVTKMEKE